MFSVRRMAVLALVATVLGCSHTEGDDPSGEAGSDGHKAVDAQTDRARPKEAASRDAWRRDARTKDVSSGEPTAPDGGVNEASADDASFGDAALDDASAEDAASYDATSGDASQGDTGSGEAGWNDASTADAGDSGTDASLATTISISPLSLQPPFSTTIHDYYVRCGQGNNTLTVSMTAAPGCHDRVAPADRRRPQGPTRPQRSPSRRTKPSWSASPPTAGRTRTGSGVFRTTSRTCRWTRHPDAGTPTPGLLPRRKHVHRALR